MGDIGVTAVLMDGNEQQQMIRPYFAKLRCRLRLHPIQFRELASCVIYKRHTMNRTPKFMTFSPPDSRPAMQVVMRPLAGLSMRPI